MKNLKRNLIIATILLFVVAAVYLNWSYNSQTNGNPDSAMVAAEDRMRSQSADNEGEGNDLAVGAPLGENGLRSAVSDYFALARLTRQQSRDESLGLLQMAAGAENASQEIIDSAMREIAVMATRTMQEAQLENLLLAKDFSECVVFMTDTDVTVAVPAPAEGLSEAAVARITDTIIAETGYDATQIRVIEVK